MSYTILTYLIHTTLWLVPLYVLYLVVYRRFTFFSWNRYYLLGIACISLVLPLVKYTIMHSIPYDLSHTATAVYSNALSTPVTSTTYGYITAAAQAYSNTYTLADGILAVYVLVALCALAMLCVNLWSIRRLIKQCKPTFTHNNTVVYTNDALPHASFFHYIFLNSKLKHGADIQKIIYHEMQHNEKLHTIDLLFCEVLKIIFWYNPLVYTYKQSLQEVHEYEVDNEMTKLYNEVTYAELLISVASTKQHSMVSAFSTKPLKNRLTMLFNPKTYPMKKLMYLLTIPLIAVLLMAYGNVQYKQVVVHNHVLDTTVKTIVIDAGHGGKDAGAIGIHGVVEKDVTLNIAKALELKAKAAGYNVILTRSTDATLLVKDRIIYSNSQKIDLYISIHNNMANNSKANGINIYTKNNDTSTTYKQSIIASSSILQQLSTLTGIVTYTTPLLRNASIWVLKQNTAPSILIELGYLSNAADVQYITNSTNQELIANKIVVGVDAYFAAK